MESNGKLNESEIEALKAQYPGSLNATFENEEGEEVTVYLKKLDRPTYEAASAMWVKSELKGGEVLLNNLWIAGYPKEKVTGELTALKNCTATIQQMLFVKTGELKKN